MYVPLSNPSAMSTKKREVIFGGRIMGARIRAQMARQHAQKANQQADRAECEAWSIQMEAFGGPAQPSPTIAQCINGGLGWLEIECQRCKTRASIPLDAVRRPKDTPIWKQRRDAEIDAFAPEALALAVQGLMHAKFVKHDRRQKLRAVAQRRRTLNDSAALRCRWLR